MNLRTSLGLACLIIVVVAGALWVGLSGNDVNACNTTGKSYIVTVRGSSVSDKNIVASKCDKLTIINQDKTVRAVAFGVHNKHISYDGISERILTKGQSLTITLTETGRYHWHDHLHDEVEGYFTVN